MKTFIEQINDAIAPVTRAWKEYEINSLTIDREGFGVDSDDELVVDVRVTLRKGST